MEWCGGPSKYEGVCVFDHRCRWSCGVVGQTVRTVPGPACPGNATQTLQPHGGYELWREVTWKCVFVAEFAQWMNFSSCQVTAVVVKVIIFLHVAHSSYCFNFQRKLKLRKKKKTAIRRQKDYFYMMYIHVMSCITCVLPVNTIPLPLLMNFSIFKLGSSLVTASLVHVVNT